jgi:hypothetical protein
MQDLMQSSRQRLFGVIHAAGGPEADVTVGPHEHGSFRSEFTLLGPGSARIDVVAAEQHLVGQVEQTPLFEPKFASRRGGLRNRHPDVAEIALARRLKHPAAHTTTAAKKGSMR